MSQVLRISISHLTALEEGRYGDLPGAVYVRGYIRAYAGYLNLDADEMLRRVHQEYYAVTEPEVINFPPLSHELRPPGAGILFYALLIAAVVTGGWYYFYNMNEEPEQEIAQPPGLDSLADAVPAASENVPGPLKPPAMSAQTPPDEQAPVAPLIPSIEELVKPEIAPENGAGRPPGVAEELAQGAEQSTVPSDGDSGLDETAGRPANGEAIQEQKWETAGLPPSPPLLASPGGVMAPVPSSGGAQAPVMLRAMADTWMQVIGPDGSEVKSWVMHAGEEYIPPNGEVLSLTIGNAGALSLFLDGAEIAPLGEKGAVIREFPLDAASLRVRFKR